jgi:hypothetical protein
VDIFQSWLFDRHRSGPPVARALRPHTHEWRSGTTHWRGAVVSSINGADCAIRVYPEASFGRTFEGPLADVPAGARTVGAPVCVRVTGSTASTWTLQEIRASHFNRADGVPSDAAAIVAGQYVAVVPRSITGESDFYDW